MRRADITRNVGADEHESEEAHELRRQLSILNGAHWRISAPFTRSKGKEAQISALFSSDAVRWQCKDENYVLGPVHV